MLRAAERLEALAERALNWGRVFPKDLEDRPAAVWLRAEEAARSRIILRRTEADRRIEEPLGALYTHLKSGMKITVMMPDGHASRRHELLVGRVVPQEQHRHRRAPPGLRRLQRMVCGKRRAVCGASSTP